MADQPRDLQDATPTHVALKVFGIAVAIGLLILGLLYIIYAGSRRGSGIKFVNPRRRTRDPETGGVDAANCSNPHRAHSVDTLPRYTTSDQALLPSGSEHGRTVEGEEAKPPPYTLDAGRFVSTEAEPDDGDGHGRVGVATYPAAVHL